MQQEQISANAGVMEKPLNFDPFATQDLPLLAKI